MKVELKTNGSIHSCKVCIHKEYCEQNKDTLLSMGEQYAYLREDKKLIPIPDNCPILKNPHGGAVKVLFT